MPTRLPACPGEPTFEMPPHALDEKCRLKMPAFLLTAHKA
jgi:hypothetical protein